MAELSTKEQLVKALYLICRNYHQHEDSGIIEYLETIQVKNQQHLRELELESLKTMSRELIKIFKDYMHYKPSTRATSHFNKYYLPLTTLLKDLR